MSTHPPVHEGKKESPPIELDAIVIGGGVQGLWILRDLRRLGYTTLLIEKDVVGGSQSLHSHGYLHQGYSYNDVQMARRLKGSQERWETFCQTKSIDTKHLASYFGFTSVANADLWEKVWEQAGLLTKRASVLPEFLRHGLLRRAYKTGDIWLDTSEIAKKLVQGFGQFILKGTVVDITYDNPIRRATKVTVEIESTTFEFAPKVVILAAGAGNGDLIEMLQESHVMPKTARLRKSQMLVIKSNDRLLRGHTAIIVPDLTLFVVSRNVGDEVVWLASYDVDEELAQSEDTGQIDTERLEETILTLSSIFPQLFAASRRSEMLLGAYVGWKAEAETGAVALPNEWVINDLNTANVYAVWPTKLTLAPEASEKLAFKLLDTVEKSQKELDIANTGLPTSNWTFGKEKWREVELRKWDDFYSFYKMSKYY